MGTIEAPPRPRAKPQNSSGFIGGFYLVAIVAGAGALFGQHVLATRIAAPAVEPAPREAIKRVRLNRERAKWLLQRADEFGDVYGTAEVTARIALSGPLQRMQDILRSVREPADEWKPRLSGADRCRLELSFVMGVRALKITYFMAQAEMEGMDALSEHDPGAWKDAEDCAKGIVEKANRFDSIIER
jgi:hypothetical protein